MAIAIPLPKLGNTVENTILVRWLKQVGDPIRVGESLCEVETDKAAMEVESPASGTILALLYKAGDDIPVMVDIAIVGAPGEDISGFAKGAGAANTEIHAPPEPLHILPVSAAPVAETGAEVRVSPRARGLAERKGVDLGQVQGSGPSGRIIERDVQAALTAGAKLTPVAKSMVAAGDFTSPERGSGAGGRITKRDLIPKTESAESGNISPDEIEVIPIKGARKIIVERMLESLQTTAQLTLNASADARALQDYRKRLKNSPADMGLAQITINDLVLFVVSRTLPSFPDLNSLFRDEAIHRYRAVHVGMAVDTERGLLVPVIRNANTLSLKALADEAHRLAGNCLKGQVKPDELSGGTFTVTNLGSLGIESFTPILNPPQVGILGVGAIQLKAVEVDGKVEFIPHMSLSLTINHQIVDGAPGARFLHALARNLSQLDLLLSL